MEILTKISDYIWIVAAIIIFASGIYFTIKLRFVQFNFRRMFRSLRKKNSNKNSISPKQALMMVLAGRVGVGSISGVALAIYTGGVGSIFWMWISAIFAVTNAFGETVLGIKYKEIDQGDIYKGGPSYYIKKGLKNKKLAILYAIIIILCYVSGFTSIQSNTIAVSSSQIFNINPIIIGFILSIIVFVIIFGGVKKISDVTSKIVPFMITLYILAGLYILVVNYSQIPLMLEKIIESAFNFKAVTGGFLGTFLIGLQRGIFSNEAGLGTGSIAASTVESNNAAEQGYIQMIGVYVTTMLICTATAIIIMTSNYSMVALEDINGIEITQNAFKYHLGSIGNIVVFISIVMFSFSTILTGYYNGESNLKLILNKKADKKVLFLKLAMILIVFFGTITSSTIIWKVADILAALLVIINVYTLLRLRHEIKEEYNKYK